MRADYKAAKALGDSAVRQAVKDGVSPYLPVLDAIDDIKHTAGEIKLGLLELPIERIAGNKEQGRNNAFANNFMPILGEGTEFGLKWSALYDSYAQEGIRDAIKCYEYMNRYYVQEGNKRVSVSKFGGSDYILADVIRILPEKSEEKEVKVYYEYLDFYNATKNFYIVFSQPGEYKRLAELLGQDYEHEWDKELCNDLKSAYIHFAKALKKVGKNEAVMTVGDSFLIYISVFPMKTLTTDSEEQIEKNIGLLRRELRTGLGMDNVQFVDAPEKSEKTASLLDIFSGAKKYTASNPLRVGFIYDAEADDSRWIDSHEAGRLYAEEIMGGNVTTACYYADEKGGDISAALEKAISDKNEMIFTVVPYMMNETLKAAVKNPGVRFMNCSVGQPQSSVRSYYGKYYEGSFLAGILAASVLMQRNTAEKRTIGYLACSRDASSVADINAFAIGASIIDPECRISLKWLSDNSDYRSEWRKENVTVYADTEINSGFASERRSGVYAIENGKNHYLGAPYFSWGKYYVAMIQTVLGGTWNVRSMMDEHAAKSYWFGLSSGVVDFRTGDIPYQTKKLLEFMKAAVISGNAGPFSGEIHSQSGIIQGEDKKSSVISSLAAKLSPENILSMDWFYENIDGNLQ